MQKCCRNIKQVFAYSTYGTTLKVGTIANRDIEMSQLKMNKENIDLENSLPIYVEQKKSDLNSSNLKVRQ